MLEMHNHETQSQFALLEIYVSIRKIIMFALPYRNSLADGKTPFSTMKYGKHKHTQYVHTPYIQKFLSDTEKSVFQLRNQIIGLWATKFNCVKKQFSNQEEIHNDLP